MYPFDPLTVLADFERQFPKQLALFNSVGIHPRSSESVFNPYSREEEQSSYKNIGEHCLAVAHCAGILAQALLRAGHLNCNDASQIVQRALVHDINKPYEIMRKNYKSSGVVDAEVYSQSAYQQLEPLLKASGISNQIAQYLVNAGTETGHNSLRTFIDLQEDNTYKLKPGMLAEKIVHLADDMTWTSNPTAGRPVTLFLKAWDRMLAAGFIEKYPWLWHKGLAVDAEKSITEVADVQLAPQDHSILGSYAHLQVNVAFMIARELQVLIDPTSTMHPEEFITQLINSDSMLR
jgi:hypothetical protein